MIRYARIVFLVANVILTMFLSSAEAVTRQNAVSGRWETLPSDSGDWQNRQNPVTGEWSYQPSDSRVEQNAPENRWEWSSGHQADWR
jgi:hypothetical protein